MRFRTCGDSGVLVELADLDETLRVFAALRSSKAAGIPGSNALDAVTQLIPAARTILISFDPLLASRADIIAAVRALDVSTDVCRRSRTVEIPVIYDGEDLADIAQLLGVSVPQVIARHCAHAWSVAFVGFAPGFAYLTGGDEIFDVPRRKVPRLSVPAGAVGLAGTFSGVYPRVSSGGWQLLGHTEKTMWDEHADPPALLQPGDAVRFTPARERVVAGTASCLSDSGESDKQDRILALQLSDSGESDKRSGSKAVLGDSGVIVSQSAANALGVKAGDTVNLTNGDGIQAKAKVSEVTRNLIGSDIYVSESYYGKLFGSGSGMSDSPESDKSDSGGSLTWNAVYAKLTGSDDAQIAYANTLEKDDSVMKTVCCADMAASFKFDLMGAVVALIVALAGGLALVVLFTLANTNVSERVREMATLKVLGFFDREVHRYVNREMMILTAMGVVIGLPIGRWVGGLLTAALNMPALYFEVEVKPMSYVIAAAATMAFALLVQLFVNPVLDRIEPVSSLKSVE